MVCATLSILNPAARHSFLRFCELILGEMALQIEVAEHGNKARARYPDGFKIIS